MSEGKWTAHVRQISLFILVGLVQLGVDSGVFVLATAAGLAIGPGNVLGRVSGACLGYWLNGRFTFADRGTARLGRRPLGRFLFAWLLLTALSTLLLQGAGTRYPLHAVWLFKPVVEAAMALIGFFVWRQWVYR